MLASRSTLSDATVQHGAQNTKDSRAQILPKVTGQPSTRSSIPPADPPTIDENESSPPETEDPIDSLVITAVSQTCHAHQPQQIYILEIDVAALARCLLLVCEEDRESVLQSIVESANVKYRFPASECDMTT